LPLTFAPPMMNRRSVRARRSNSIEIKTKYTWPCQFGEINGRLAGSSIRADRWMARRRSPGTRWERLLAR
jgi:hypothetical protein